MTDTAKLSRHCQVEDTAEGNSVESNSFGLMTREKRKDTEKLFKELIDYHYVKKSYNTRRSKPT